MSASFFVRVRKSGFPFSRSEGSAFPGNRRQRRQRSGDVRLNLQRWVVACLIWMSLMFEADLADAEEREGKSPKVVSVMATGYTAGVESTGKTPSHPQYGITYSGVKVRRSKVSTIAADPKLFPIGTLLYIPGYGYGCVADTGSRIKGRKIDLYFPSKRQVFREWGKKRVDVQVIRWGSGKVTETMLDAMNEVAAAQQDLSTKKFNS